MSRLDQRTYIDPINIMHKGVLEALTAFDLQSTHVLVLGWLSHRANFDAHGSGGLSHAPAFESRDCVRSPLKTFAYAIVQAPSFPH